MAMRAMENKGQVAVGGNNDGRGALYRVVTLSDLGITGPWGFRREGCKAQGKGGETGGCSCHPGQ